MYCRTISQLRKLYNIWCFVHVHLFLYTMKWICWRKINTAHAVSWVESLTHPPSSPSQVAVIAILTSMPRPKTDFKGVHHCTMLNLTIKAKAGSSLSLTKVREGSAWCILRHLAISSHRSSCWSLKYIYIYYIEIPKYLTSFITSISSPHSFVDF